MKPVLSILLPTHNRCDTLEIALTSLMAQSFSDWEVLVVGDGCTDGTGALLEAFQKNDSRLSWFDLPKGLGFGYANRNVALREAKGELIGFMADDDIVFGNHLGHLVELMENPAVHLGVVGSLWVDDGGRMIPAIGPLHDKAYLAAFLEGENRLPASAFIHRRSAYAEVGYWREDLIKHGDLELWQRIIARWSPQSIRTDPRCSCVHFRAPWKQQGRDPDPHDFVIWQDLISEGRLEEELCISGGSGSGGEKLQQLLWQTLLKDPALSESLERIATRMLETYAYAAMSSVSHLHGELGRLVALLAEAEAAGIGRDES